MNVKKWAAWVVLATSIAPAMSVSAAPIKNVVLVHGAFADGSGWKGVADILRGQGYNVSVVQHPDSSLKEDVAATRRILDRQDGPVVLVGHSYGGTVITEAGNHPKVKTLVYVSAYAPDAGEDPKALRATKPPITSNIVQIGNDFIIRNPETFPEDFAGDLPKDVARFMAISQVPTAVPAALGAPVTAAAWRSKPSWYIVSTEDRIINPELQRYMAQRAKSKTVELRGSHSVFIAQPAEVAKVIVDAAK
jgi:pimeloyl-ACP methyl ester carboxylesterase